MAFFQDNLVAQHQKGKPFWIILVQEIMGWQWHQLDHMQIICTLLQIDNHASSSPLRFLQAGCPSCRPTNGVKALKANQQYSGVLAVEALPLSLLECLIRQHALIFPPA